MLTLRDMGLNFARECLKAGNSSLPIFWLNHLTIHGPSPDPFANTCGSTCPGIAQGSTGYQAGSCFAKVDIFSELNMLCQTQSSRQKTLVLPTQANIIKTMISCHNAQCTGVDNNGLMHAN